MTKTNDELLKVTLSVAVPLWILEFRRKTPDEIQAIAAVAGQAIAEHGDIIQFKSKTEGATANAFNQLARGLAALAFSPGGVTFCDLHFEAKLDSPTIET